MVSNACGISASRIHPKANGEPLPGPRSRSAAGKLGRDLKTIASDEAGLQRCPRQLRKLLPLGRRQVARHAASRKAAAATFNPHSAPPPERRFSATRSFDYRSRGNAIASGSMGTPRPPVKRLSAQAGAGECRLKGVSTWSGCSVGPSRSTSNRARTAAVSSRSSRPSSMRR